MMYILYNTFSYLQAGNIENVVVQDIKFTFRAIVLEKYEKKHIIQNVLCILHNPVEGCGYEIYRKFGHIDCKNIFSNTY